MALATVKWLPCWMDLWDKLSWDYMLFLLCFCEEWYLDFRQRIFLCLSFQPFRSNTNYNDKGFGTTSFQNKTIPLPSASFREELTRKYLKRVMHSFYFCVVMLILFLLWYLNFFIMVQRLAFIHWVDGSSDNPPIDLMMPWSCYGIGVIVCNLGISCLATS